MSEILPSISDCHVLICSTENGGSRILSYLAEICETKW